jgi:hypothetical protein
MDISKEIFQNFHSKMSISNGIYQKVYIKWRYIKTSIAKGIYQMGYIKNDISNGDISKLP